MTGMYYLPGPARKDRLVPVIDRAVSRQYAHDARVDYGTVSHIRGRTPSPGRSWDDSFPERSFPVTFGHCGDGLPGLA